MAGKDSGEPVWSVRIRQDGPAQAAVFADQAKLIISPRAGLQSRGELANPIQLALGAVGAELMGALMQEAQRRRWIVDALECQVKAALRSPLAALGVQGEEGDPRFREISARLSLSSPVDPGQAEAAFRLAEQRCCLWLTLGAACSVRAELRTL